LSVSTRSASFSSAATSVLNLSSSSLSTAAATPTVPITVQSVGNYQFTGCYTEGTTSRALLDGVLIDYTSMTGRPSLIPFPILKLGGCLKKCLADILVQLKCAPASAAHLIPSSVSNTVARYLNFISSTTRTFADMFLVLLRRITTARKYVGLYKRMQPALCRKSIRILWRWKQARYGCTD